jgi:hypothetical protein
MKKSAILACAIILSSFLTTASAFDCSGNACNDVVFSYINNCYNIKNIGQKRIKVQMGGWSFTLQAGETRILTAGNYCVHSYVGDNKANYE